MPLVSQSAAAGSATRITLPAETMMKYAGVYALDETPTFKLTMTIENGVMIVAPTGQGKIEDLPGERDEILPQGGGCADHVFHPPRTAKPAFLTLHQNGADHRATKLP